MHIVKGFEIKPFGPFKNDFFLYDNKNWLSHEGSLCSKYPALAGKLVDVVLLMIIYVCHFRCLFSNDKSGWKDRFRISFLFVCFLRKLLPAA